MIYRWRWQTVWQLHWYCFNNHILHSLHLVSFNWCAPRNVVWFLFIKHGMRFFYYFFKHRSFIHKSHSTFAVYGNLNISLFFIRNSMEIFFPGKFHRWVSTSHSIYGMKKTKFMVAMFIDCNRSISRLLTASPYSS